MSQTSTLPTARAGKGKASCQLTERGMLEQALILCLDFLKNRKHLHGVLTFTDRHPTRTLQELDGQVLRLLLNEEVCIVGEADHGERAERNNAVALRGVSSPSRSAPRSGTPA